MSYLHDKELIYRLVDEVRLRRSLPVTAAAALVNEWAPGRGTALLDGFSSWPSEARRHVYSNAGVLVHEA